MFSKSQQMTHQFKQLFTCDNEISFDWGFKEKKILLHLSVKKLLKGIINHF